MLVMIMIAVFIYLFIKLFDSCLSSKNKCVCSSALRILTV